MTNAAPSSPKSHKLWGGRFGAGPTPEFDALNNSIGIDFRLWPHDIRLSRAWAVALWGANVLTLEESRTIEGGLEAVSFRRIAAKLGVSGPTLYWHVDSKRRLMDLMAEELVRRGVGRVVVTLGKEGVLVVGPDEQFRVPGRHMKAIDTTGVEPLSQPIAAYQPNLALRLRDDVVNDGGIRELLMINAPQAEHGFFTVPKVIE